MKSLAYDAWVADNARRSPKTAGKGDSDILAASRMAREIIYAHLRFTQAKIA